MMLIDFKLGLTNGHLSLDLKYAAQSQLVFSCHDTSPREKHFTQCQCFSLYLKNNGICIHLC